MSTSRRKFLGIAATTGVGALLPWQVRRASAQQLNALVPGLIPVASPPLAKFVTALPKPGVAQAAAFPNGVPLYNMSLVPVDHVAHPSLGVTPAWGYGDGFASASFPGPTIEARLDTPLAVQWANNLPATHLLQASIDPAVHGADPAVYPPVRIVTHLHGGHVPAGVDGGPEAWYASPATQGYNQLQGPRFTGDTYFYPNGQHRATTLWYHDHALGITRLNVYAGLAGFYLIRSAEEDALNLPNGNYEIPIVFQDRMFNPDGTLYYPPAPNVPEFFGDVMVVNGQVWPRLVVEARKYRFRFLNGCNSRFLRMQLFESDMNGVIPNGAQVVPGPTFDQIGSDGGLFNQTAPMPILTMGPGERCDVIIDFSKALGKGAMKPQKRAYFLLYNDAGTPFANTKSTMGAIPEVMLFEVMPAQSVDTSSALPAASLANPRVVRLNEAAATTTRNLTLEEAMGMGGGLISLLNGVPFDVAVTETPRIGDTEVWNIINLTPDTHPIHLHQTMFQLLDRRPFDVRRYLRDYAALNLAPTAPRPAPTNYYTGAVLPPDLNELGWKDTIRANPGEVTRIIMKWENPYPAGQPYPAAGADYVWHCHILEHEDNEMMRPLKVLGPSGVAAG